jgi:L-threonylcarbamoyladenylate synthase
VIAFPTDTVYGVGARGFDERAIEKLYAVKQRPRDKAIPLLLASVDDLENVAREIPDAARQLAARFFPGALTLIMIANPRVPAILRAGGSTIAVRVPDHAFVQSLIRALGEPLAATSANISGARDPATASEVLAQLAGRLSLILDGGATRGNVPSTVVDVTTDPPTVRRVGVIAVAEIEQVLASQLVAQLTD